MNKCEANRIVTNINTIPFSKRIAEKMNNKPEALSCNKCGKKYDNFVNIFLEPVNKLVCITLD